MTRIVSGFAGSLRLAVPRSGTRPTSDRVREAIFSALDARDAIAGAEVLDLYAGSGALGLEAASRGAASVVLVERNPAAAALCRRNAEAVVAAAGSARRPRVRVATAPVQAFLDAGGAPVDLVFIDPPYDLDEPDLARVLAALVPRLADAAAVVIERSTRSPQPSLPAGLELERERRYGETVLWWLQPATPSQPA
ncbi:16S rRNA (guanine(966)-N(2))-methyltransferase RsmD [Glaciibacter flavus]|uniref:16S rRNA (Guanine(966)-N(2))-methyltransferase RsmD n=1 Tax=Orlajensenia flava TaxID=2565934 RepID=A0A4S4FYZ6_9MICO|nr:16S rRNA (guanine(966)-N(2))-methyltransferase RsmD [Glaciibacter flavus]THG34956.1 16S rRNA (guanine(966)-N(2))-methyltransferase RsmD [Glaciibacter flavus]